MARTQRRVELKKRRKKRLEGSGGCAREPLHVELLRSAVVVNIDGKRSQGKKGRHLSSDGYIGGEGEVVEKRKISASLPSSVAGRVSDSNAFFASSDSETELAADVPHGAAADKKTASAAGGKRRALPEQGRGGEGLLVPAALSKKILRLAEHQQRAADFSDSEDERGDAAEDVLFGSDEEFLAAGRVPSVSIEHVDAEGYVILDQGADAAEEQEDEVYVQRILQQKAAGTKGEEEEDTAAAAPSLVDSILEKLKTRDTGEEHRDPLVSRPSDPGAEEAAAFPSGGSSSSTTSSGLPPKIIEVYTAMAPFLQKYRSGKLPKAFKVLPRLQQWEEILMLTQPQSWSPHTLAAATKVFCSNLSSSAVQRFLCLVLLPAVREDIAEHKKLNYHLYQALKKALFKPAAFFKGIFLPLALEGCSRKEAVIVGSVVAKVSIPVLHGAAALLRLSLVPPSDWLPTVSLLMNVLINKKYSLPTKAVQACVLHFHSFRSHAEKLPVSWHKAFLSFVQRYKLVLADSDRSKLHEVLRTHFHELIGPEIRRELLAKNPAAVLEQQALLLEKRQKQQQLEQQQRKTGAAVTAIAAPVEEEV